MSLQETNLEDILSFYFYETDAREALEELERKIKSGRDAWLRRMLRHHAEESVYNPNEIAFRDGVDDLMVFCNVAETAATGRLISMQPSRSWSWGPLSRVLRNVHVETFYKDFYPDRLPQLLLKRIDGSHVAVEKVGAENLCLGFLELDRQFVRNHRRRYLLKLLDDFTLDGIRFSDVTKLLETPERVLDSLFKTDGDKDAIDEAVSEFSQFLSFCTALKEQLDEMKNFPLLRAEVWSRYAYWFEIIAEELRKRLGKAVDKFVSWKPTAGGKRATEDIQNFVAAAKKTLKNLCSKSYGVQVDTILSRPD